MIVNQTTAIIGSDIVLVPYRLEHVPTYHNWMLSEELRKLTASDPLTLGEEFVMQQKWQNDADKLTFIILARPHLASNSRTSIVHDDEKPNQEDISTFPMIGDVNLFLKGNPEDDDGEIEAEVMIAEGTYRRKGVACSALHLLFHYATSVDGPPSLRFPAGKLIVRISETNHASQKLFEKLGFVITKRVPVFQELEMRYNGNGNWIGGQIVVYT